MNRSVLNVACAMFISVLVMAAVVGMTPRTASAGLNCNAGSAIVSGSFMLIQGLGGATASVDISNSTATDCFVLLTLYVNIKDDTTGYKYLATISQVLDVVLGGGTGSSFFAAPTGFSVEQSTSATAVLRHYNPADR
jgi:hypothetical protein